MARNIAAKFFRHCETNGITLMHEDRKFIVDRLCQIPIELHRDALRGYISSWYVGEGEAENDAQRQNMGRRNANLYLLCYDRTI